MQAQRPKDCRLLNASETDDFALGKRNFMIALHKILRWKEVAGLYTR